MLRMGHSEGAQNAAVTIVSYLDFECPFCRQSELDLIEPFRAAHAENVRVIRLHFPLGGHPYVMTAAHAAECAGAQGKFSAYSARLFKRQKELSQDPYSSIAYESGVPDLESFEDCREAKRFLGVIESHRTLGNRLGVSGTPTVVVNGAMYPGGGPTRHQLDSIIHEAS